VGKLKKKKKGHGWGAANNSRELALFH